MAKYLPSRNVSQSSTAITKKQSPLRLEGGDGYEDLCSMGLGAFGWATRLVALDLQRLCTQGPLPPKP